MTLEQAIEKAKTESLKGYVQHVNTHNKMEEIDFYVSDWFDSDCTVASYENGEEL